MAVVGLEETFYNTEEEQGAVQVCAIVYMPDNTVPCPITFEFTVFLSNNEFTAGRSTSVYYHVFDIIYLTVSDTHGLWRNSECSPCVPSL